jgi:hypothetical protein
MLACATGHGLVIQAVLGGLALGAKPSMAVSQFARRAWSWRQDELVDVGQSLAAAERALR